jgi:AcrR family transcriptional regulator
MVTSQRVARKKEATRRQIVRVGIDLFSAHGLEAVTVDQIAEAADVGKGTIYNYFHTKEDIVVAFMTDVERKVQAKLRTFDATSRAMPEVLTEFIQVQFRMKRRYHRFVRMFFAQMFLHTDQFLPYMAEIYQLLAPNIAALFEALMQGGEIRADVPVSDLTLVFANLQFGLTAQWAIEGPPFRGTEFMMQREILLFCEGLIARKR